MNVGPLSRSDGRTVIAIRLGREHPIATKAAKVADYALVISGIRPLQLR